MVLLRIAFVFLFTVLSQVLPAQTNEKAFFKNFREEVIISSSGDKKTITSCIIQINHKLGEDYCQIVLPYKEQSPIRKLKAHIQYPEGEII
ncbi:MAG: hypothetical protein ACPF9D_00235, partial [Owenweeksia sp.]